MKRDTNQWFKNNIFCNIWIRCKCKRTFICWYWYPYNSSTGVISASGSADTTGNGATATALETERTIHGVSFDGTANIDLTEVIQDTVGSLISGSGSTTVTYNDRWNTSCIINR